LRRLEADVRRLNRDRTAGGMEGLTVFTLTSKETSEDGRFARQFFKCTRDISAAVDCAFFLGAILSVWRL